MKSLTILFSALFLMSALAFAEVESFSLRNLDGELISSDDYIGKGPVLLDFWATWCRPCIKSIPHMATLHKKYEGKVTVVGVNIWQPDPESVGPFIEKMGDEMPYGIATDVVPGHPATASCRASTRFTLPSRIGCRWFMLSASIAPAVDRPTPGSAITSSSVPGNWPA